MSSDANTDLRDPLLCAARACFGCRSCGEMIKPFPAGSHCIRVYAGEEQFCYQVVEAFNGRAVNVLFSDGGEWHLSPAVRIAWLRGSARELAEALCAEVRP